jgi:hypothetical protein
MGGLPVCVRMLARFHQGVPGLSPHDDAALDYAARGFLVFPVAPRGKLPAIPSAHGAGESPCAGECGRDGHGFYDATTDPDRITEWWRRWPTANVGLRTGVVFDVVDIDGPEGLAALDSYRADRPVTWGPEVRTGGGGWHLFHLPTGAGCRTAMLPKVDFRGAGGYVVAPPSIHPSGRPYSWHEMAGPDEPLEPLPDWLLELVLPAPPAPAPTNGKIRTLPSAYARRALESELGRVAMACEGDRNHQLNRSAFALGQLVASGALTAEVVVAGLVDAAARAGLAGREVEKTIASGLRNGMRSPRQVPA